MNIGLDPHIVEAPFKLPRLCRFVKRRDRHHKFYSFTWTVDKTSTNGRAQDSPAGNLYPLPCGKLSAVKFREQLVCDDL